MSKNLELASDTHDGKKPARPKSLAKRVREVLLSLGGEAHRGLVIEQVVGLYAVPPPGTSLSRRASSGSPEQASCAMRRR